MVDTSMAPCGTRQDVGWDLVDERCDDPDWVRAEFDALVALTWPDDDHDDSGPAAAGRLAGPNEAVQADPDPAGAKRRRWPPQPGTDAWARQRSPP